LDLKNIRTLAGEVDASERDVAACLRSGEALRCRFLVPSLPAPNETPDELSAPWEPEWLNPDYDENDDVFDLTQEDKDTAEILMGMG
jgi:hypothetical protein